MTKRRLKSPRARLFFALDLPGEVREAIDGWGVEALADPSLRRVPRESLHITLAFLGYLPEKQIPRLAEIAEASRGPAPSIALGDPVQRPQRGRARLYALPAESPGTVSLQRALSERLVAAGLYEPEKRPFWPHVTIARVRREERGSRRPASVARPPQILPEALLRPFVGVRMTLYRSELQSRGAQYIPQALVELPADGQQ